MTNKNFTLLSSEYLPTLDVTLEYYEHHRTKAKHVHFASKNRENTFMVALRTMPHDSTGVAHILEHTALCGSKNFPVRDPFFGMLKRSMQTFMNAFTSSDWTAYPFATENKQDFDNLLRVYLDAVFFPNLDELDFMQEWHRFDFDEAGNLVLKGVVYNEMKGVYGSAFERIYETNKSLLHPETTYHYDSGGAPQVIPRLTYEAFRAFHTKHYYPTNATFMTFGDIAVSEHQEKFENLVLQYFANEWEKVTTTDETRFLGQVNSRQYYPSTEKENPNRVHILFSWLLESAHNAKNHLEADLIYAYLLGHSGSPLRHALEDAEYTASVSPLSMLDDSGRELRIVTGIITSDEKYADETEKLVYDTLEAVIKNGVDTNEAIGILDSIEMSLRELNTGYPYGLSLMLQAIGAVTHDENISLMLDPSVLLDELREKVKDRNFIPSLIEKYLLKNTHKTRLVMIPSETASEREIDLEKNYCKKMQENMTNDDIAKIRDNVKKLEEHQQKEQNMDLLPKLQLSDIPTEMKPLPSPAKTENALVYYSVATNSINYIKHIFPIGGFSLSELPALSLTIGLLGELGFDGKDYTESQKLLSEKWSFSARLGVFSPYKQDDIRGYFMTSGRFLERNSVDSLALLDKFTHTTIFSETEQIRQIFSEKLVSFKSALTSSGHATAMLRASAGHTLAGTISESLGGITNMYFLKNFLKNSDSDMQAIFEKNYTKIREHDEFTIAVAKENFTTAKNSKNIAFDKDLLNENFTPKRTNEAWLADLAVGYCALSVPTVPAHHEDAPILVLLGQFLRDGYLHSAIREKGGAYGAGANYDGASQSFRFFSYRDPRIEGTYEDFAKSVVWLLENEHETERLDEAKMGVIARVDAPASPAKDAIADAINTIKGYTRDDANRERKIILEATIDDLKRVTKKYLMNLSEASRVVITGKQNRETALKMGFEVKELE